MKNRILYTIILATCTLLAHAQSAVQNNGVIQVSNAGDILYINGALTNANTATLTNNGDLYVLQNITNNQASMAVGTGRLLLTGTGAQAIGGAQPFRTFNLTTNNSAGITLNSNLHVSGSHSYVAGVIASSATPNYLIYEAGSSYTGSSHAAHVSGWVKKIGSTAFTFPVGTNNYLRAVTVTNLSAASEFNVRHNLTTPNTFNMAVPLQVINPGEYWTVNRVSGGTAQVTMNWNNPAIAFFQHWLIDYRAVYNNAGTWINLGGNATGTPSTTGSITSSVVNAFGNFGFGSVNAEILPVQFLGVWGYAYPTHNLIQWKTNDEYNIARFEVQRSTDATTFAKIAEQAPNNVTGIHAYEYKDMQQPGGASWYRIRTVDLDGQSQYSAVVRIAPASGTDGMHIINTMVSDKIAISTTDAYKGDYQYMLVSNSGQTVQQGKFVVSGTGITTLTLNGNVTNGTYMLYLFNNKYQSVNKIIVK